MTKKEREKLVNDLKRAGLVRVYNDGSCFIIKDRLERDKEEEVDFDIDFLLKEKLLIKERSDSGGFVDYRISNGRLYTFKYDNIKEFREFVESMGGSGRKMCFHVSHSKT